MKNTDVDIFIENAPKWNEEMSLLRDFILDCSLTEEFKWKQPCYTYHGQNICMIANFKAFVALSFLKGVLLADAQSLLVSPGENSQSVKYLKFTCCQEIMDHEATIKAYLYEAIEIEKAGIPIVKTKSTDLEYVAELQVKLNESSEFAAAFQKLTDGRKRGYHLYFSGAKQSKTRENRIEQYRTRIMKGQGIHDCVCGHSKRMPTCDGSHKYLA